MNPPTDRHSRATLVPTAPPPDAAERLDPQTALLVNTVERLARGRGPLVSGLMGGALAVVIHHFVTKDDTSKRLESIECHLRWTQAAIVAQSRAEPLPPPSFCYAPEP